MKLPPELEKVARRLGGDLRDRSVFVGGMVRGILVTDPAAGPARPTKDVDLIMEIRSRAEYVQLTEDLRARGFHESTEENAPTCRWVVEGTPTDIMPVDPHILGFSNVWYEGAASSAIAVASDAGEIRVIDAARYCATKLEAHASRGEGDYYHPDIEDFIALVDGRPSLLSELRSAPDELRGFLATRVGSLLSDPAFREAVRGHLLPDEASQARLPVVLQTLGTIASMHVKAEPRQEPSRITAPISPGVPGLSRGALLDLGAPHHLFVRSSNLLKAWYDEPSRTLSIQFRSGGLYAYDGVPAEVYRGLTGAYSAGRYLNVWIKRRYRVRRLR